LLIGRRRLTIGKDFNLWKIAIVLGVIGSLAILAFPQLAKVAEKQKVTSAKVSLSALRKAEGIWFVKHSAYTKDLIGLAKETPEMAQFVTGDKDWFYAVTPNPDFVTDFLATATRHNGPAQFNGLTITIDRMGRWAGTHQLKAD